MSRFPCSIAWLLLLAAGAAAQTPPSVSTTSLPAASVGVPYTATLTASGGTPPYTWSISGAIPPGLTVFTSGLISGTPTVSGSFTFTAIVNDARLFNAVKTLTLTVSGQTSRLAIVTTSPLPTGVVGQSYQQTLTATSGTPPYQWSAGAGLPAGLSLNASTGEITGTPTADGTFSFTVQVRDTSQNTASSTFSLRITANPLTITTLSPLFNGTVGVAYAQTFSASGGRTPYSWSVLSGDTGGLTLDPSSGTLRGTPQNAGTLSFTIQVTDGAGNRASQQFSITVNPPALSLTASGQMPSGTAGSAYNQPFPVVPTGGTPPYTWSLNGSVPGLDFDSVNVALTGTPSSAGTFPITLQVRDSTGQTASRPFTITIGATALTITTARQLPDVTFNSSVSQQLAGAGGVPPYTWSASGLPAGLAIDSRSGLISGTAIAAGSFSFAVSIADNALNRFSDRFTINILLPATPPVTISGLPAVVTAAQQYPVQISLGAPFPTAITGQALLSFAPDNGPADRTVVFSTGGTTANFTIDAGSTTPVFSQPLMVQTGTVSGTIGISLRLQAGVTDITPSPAPVMSAQLARAAPTVKGVQVSRTASAISIAITGYSTSREVLQIVYAFSAANGQTLQPGASSITVPVETLFTNWFQDGSNAAYGSQFVFTLPFTIQGDPNAVTPVSVTVTNRQGPTTFNITP